MIEKCNFFSTKKVYFKQPFQMQIRKQKFITQEKNIVYCDEKNTKGKEEIRCISRTKYWTFGENQRQFYSVKVQKNEHVFIAAHKVISTTKIARNMCMYLSRAK